MTMIGYQFDKMATSAIKDAKLYFSLMGDVFYRNIESTESGLFTSYTTRPIPNTTDKVITILPSSHIVAGRLIEITTPTDITMPENSTLFFRINLLADNTTLGTPYTAEYKVINRQLDLFVKTNEVVDDVKFKEYKDKFKNTLNPTLIEVPIYTNSSTVKLTPEKPTGYAFAIDAEIKNFTSSVLDSVNNQNTSQLSTQSVGFSLYIDHLNNQNTSKFTSFESTINSYQVVNSSKLASMNTSNSVVNSSVNNSVRLSLSTSLNTALVSYNGVLNTQTSQINVNNASLSTSVNTVLASHAGVLNTQTSQINANDSSLNIRLSNYSNTINSNIDTKFSLYKNDVTSSVNSLNSNYYATTGKSVVNAQVSDYLVSNNSQLNNNQNLEFFSESKYFKNTPIYTDVNFTSVSYANSTAAYIYYNYKINNQSSYLNSSAVINGNYSNSAILGNIYDSVGNVAAVVPIGFMTGSVNQSNTLDSYKSQLKTFNASNALSNSFYQIDTNIIKASNMSVLSNLNVSNLTISGALNGATGSMSSLVVKSQLEVGSIIGSRNIITGPGTNYTATIANSNINGSFNYKILGFGGLGVVKINNLSLLNNTSYSVLLGPLSNLPLGFKQTLFYDSMNGQINIETKGTDSLYLEYKHSNSNKGNYLDTVGTYQFVTHSLI